MFRFTAFDLSWFKFAFPRFRITDPALRPTSLSQRFRALV